MVPVQMGFFLLSLYRSVIKGTHGMEALERNGYHMLVTQGRKKKKMCVKHESVLVCVVLGQPGTNLYGPLD